MKQKVQIHTVIVFACLAILGAGGAIATRLLVGAPPRVATSGTALVGGPFTLVATDGTAVSDQSYRGKWQIIYFGYTFCPDACPVALAKLSTALEKLGPGASKLQALFITVDPKRDTQQVITEYLKSFDSRIVGLTGAQAEIESIVKEYRVYAAPQKTGGSDYLVDHSAYFYVMGPQGTFVNVLDPDLSGEEIADRLRKAMNSRGAEE